MVERNLQKNSGACVICGLAKGVERGQKNGFHVLSCRACGMLYTVRAGGVAHDYDEYYSEENLSVPDFINKRLDEIVSSFAPYRQSGRLLDVGFGAGVLMEAAARANWKVMGVEVSRPAVEHLQARGFEAFCGELSEAKYPNGHFDVVTASEVLEHVTDPRSLVKEMARVLRPGGLLWATTPHGKGLSSRMLGLKWSVISPPEHLQLFSLRSLRSLLAEAGFSKIWIAAQGVNPAEILSGLRHRGQDSEASPEPCNRVESSYKMNEFMSQSRAHRALKAAINGFLSISRLGDSLKVWAEK